LIDRLIHLILTLHVSFSTMKIIKTRLRNKMKDEFLTGSMIIYIEKGMTENFSSDSIIDECGFELKIVFSVNYHNFGAEQMKILMIIYRNLH